MIRKSLSIFISLNLLLSTALSVQAEELLWYEQAGELICKQQSEGLRLASDAELLSIHGMDQLKNRSRPVKSRVACRIPIDETVPIADIQINQRSH